MTWRLTRKAKADLDDIWDYSARRWSKDQTEKHLRTIQTALEALAVDPAIGRTCDHIRQGHLRYAAGSHILCFRRAGAEIIVVRILHRRMDFERHL